ncbi:cytochrome P450 [Actinopolymorpha sp. B9G3]|uniref:cytochrome P450 n=1 Tax=Actinopolymorpha sp. B9G3 TaxID=3158970 RepID=UPI0032D9522E
MTLTTAPTPTSRPLVGSMLDLRRDSLGTYVRAFQECGDVVRFVVGPPGLRLVVHGVFSPDGARQVLSDAALFRKDNRFYLEVRESFGNGLLTSQDTDYARQRRLIQPLFTRRRVDLYAAAMCEEVGAAVEAWRGATGQVVDVIEESTRLTLRVVARILFGADVDDAIETVRRSFPVIGEYTRRRGLSPIHIPRQWSTSSNRRAAAALRELYGVCDRIIDERRGAGTASTGKGTAEGAEGTDLLSLLARATDEDGDSLAASEIRDQVLIFLLAGHETTATSLGFALHLLARHPDEQARAREEVDQLLGGRVPEARDLDVLPYTTQVLKEAMRLYPAAPATGRLAVTETEIGGFAIPAGGQVFVSPWVTHRHPAYLDEPEVFDPDRFTPEAEAARPRYAWFPFGGGPRACIGQHFSMLESVLALALVLQAYELTAIDTEVPLAAGITLRAAGPVRCRLIPR